MHYDQHPRLSGYIGGLLAEGRATFDAEEAQAALGVGRGAFLDAAERLQRRKALMRPRQGFYVAVPQQFASWGAPPPSWYIDALMRHENTPYYVGLWKAAELHGATHQAVMAFQVVAAKRMPKIRAGRSYIFFYYRKDMDAAEAGIETRKTDTGEMRISCVEMTVLDLLRYPHGAGGIDNIATMLSDLAVKIDPERLARLSRFAQRPVVQRLGHLLDRLGHNSLTVLMLEALRSHKARLPWVELDPREAGDLDLSPEPQEYDDCWRVIVRHVPELDE